LELPYAEVVVGAQIAVTLPAEEPPDADAERFAENVPERDLDTADRRHSDDAHAPETVPGEDLRAVFDVARVLIDEERREVFDGADHRARLPFERGLPPAEEARFVGVDPDEDPVAHFRVADARRDRGD